MSLDLEACLTDIDLNGEIPKQRILEFARDHRSTIQPDSDGARSDELAKCWYLEARCALFLGHLDDAIAAFEAAADAAYAASMLELNTQSLLDLGVTHQYAGNYREASALLIRALDQAELSGSPGLIGRSHYAVAASWSSQQAHELCRRSAETAVAYACRAGDHRIEAQACGAIATSFSELGQHDEALAWIDRAETVCGQHGFERFGTFMKITRLNLLHRAGQITEAASDIASLLTDADRIPLPVRAGVQIHSAEIRADEGDFEGARTVLDEVRQSVETTDLRLHEVAYLRTSARVSEALGDHTSAVADLKALDTANSLHRGPQLEACIVAMTQWQDRERYADGNQALAAWNEEASDHVASLDRLRGRQSELLELAAHDLRAPLAAIRLRTDALNDSDIARHNASIHSYLLAVEGCVVEALSVVDDLAEHATDPGAERRSDLTSHDPTELVDQIVETCRPLADRKLVQILVAPHPQTAAVLADQWLLKRALRNLLDNAIKFSPIESAVSLSVSQERDIVHISIEDSGPGVPEEVAQSMFDKYVRFDENELVPGTGLGLFIARQLIEQVGGTVQLSPGRQGIGTSVDVRLPAASSLT